MDSRKLWPNQMVSFLPRTTAGAAADAAEDVLKVESSFPPAVVAARAVVSFSIERRDMPRGFRPLSDIVGPSILLLPHNLECPRLLPWPNRLPSRSLAPPLLPLQVG